MATPRSSQSSLAQKVARSKAVPESSQACQQHDLVSFGHHSSVVQDELILFKDPPKPVQKDLSVVAAISGQGQKYPRMPTKEEKLKILEQFKPQLLEIYVTFTRMLARARTRIQEKQRR